jgi:UDP-glucose 4-epimerase
MRRIDEGLPPIIHGDGSESMDFVYVDDVARANLLAVTAEATDAVCNIASGCETTLDVLAHTLIAVMDADLAPVYEPVRSLANVPQRLADISHAQRLLGWRPEVDLQTGLERLVGWWRASARSQAASA